MKKITNEIAAAITFFTKLPLWRVVDIESNSFRNIVSYWPLTGFITGGIMSLTFFLAAHVLPFHISIVLAFFSRTLLTGALHEDGLADFADGFGGGTSRERILEIMKDSHIGTYGVISLIGYFLFIILLTTSIPFNYICPILFCADIWSKYCSSLIVNRLPYARTKETSKAKTIYNKTGYTHILINSLIVGTPIILLLPIPLWFPCMLPLITSQCLFIYLRRKVNGYTGDCCGAVFLISELTFYLGTAIITYNAV